MNKNKENNWVLDFASIDEVHKCVCDDCPYNKYCYPSAWLSKAYRHNNKNLTYVPLNNNYDSSCIAELYYNKSSKKRYCVDHILSDFLCKEIKDYQKKNLMH